jgi:hypothetical protein
MHWFAILLLREFRIQKEDCSVENLGFPFRIHGLRDGNSDKAVARNSVLFTVSINQ